MDDILPIIRYWIPTDEAVFVSFSKPAKIYATKLKPSMIKKASNKSTILNINNPSRSTKKTNVANSIFSFCLVKKICHRYTLTIKNKMAKIEKITLFCKITFELSSTHSIDNGVVRMIKKSNEEKKVIKQSEEIAELFSSIKKVKKINSVNKTANSISQ